MGKTLVGTTDTVVESIVQHPTATEKEVNFILENLKDYVKNLKEFKPEELFQSKW